MYETTRGVISSAYPSPWLSSACAPPPAPPPSTCASTLATSKGCLSPSTMCRAEASADRVLWSLRGQERGDGVSLWIGACLAGGRVAEPARARGKCV